jgi:DnaJ-class molecular chaperone
MLQIVESPHQNFKRSGDNLIYTHSLNLFQALTAEPFYIIMLDGSYEMISPSEVISPSGSITIQGKGMPLLGMNGQRGHLVIQFNIAFP